jgi:hypothetical protein
MPSNFSPEPPPRAFAKAAPKIIAQATNDHAEDDRTTTHKQDSGYERRRELVGGSRQPAKTKDCSQYGSKYKLHGETEPIDFRGFLGMKAGHRTNAIELERDREGEKQGARAET